jgi:DNA-binding CsgD family transcriptional regulator
MQSNVTKSLRRAGSGTPAIVAQTSAPSPSLVRDTDELIRKLVEHVKDREPRRADAADGGVIFAAEVDGVRYLLTRTPTAMNLVTLSPREKEIARMVAKGLPDKAIAAVLDISRYTVSTHLRRMYAKAGVASRAAMVAKIMAGGLWK